MPEVSSREKVKSLSVDTCTHVLNKAENDKIPSQEAAMLLAEKRIAEVGNTKLSR